MVLSTFRHWWASLRPKHRLSCRRTLWRRLAAKLRERGGGYREAGAFLLGRRVGDTRVVEDFILYDDVDPTALRGIIVFDAGRIDLVWARCAELGMEVVADIHTHPAGFGQSSTDRAHPMIPQKGHLALIMPNFAQRAFEPPQLGIYEYRGRDGWIDHSASGRRFFRIG
jgi:proteasome lid subunit RPN8/RPN11